MTLKGRLVITPATLCVSIVSALVPTWRRFDVWYTLTYEGDEWLTKYGVTFSRKTDKPRNPGNALDATDTKTFTAMKIDMENKKPLSSKVIQAEDGHPIYYKPLLISNDVCLKCHGSLDKESENKIRSIYQEDKATEYKIGDLRALIRIDFNH